MVGNPKDRDFPVGTHMYTLDQGLLSILSFFKSVITIDHNNRFDVSYDTKIISTISFGLCFGVKTQAFAISKRGGVICSLSPILPHQPYHDKTSI